MTAPQTVLCVMGTRPEAIKLAPVLRALRADPGRFAPRILATAQHRHMLDQMLAVFDLRPDADLDVMRPGQTPAEVTSRVLDGVSAYLAAHPADIVLAQGDTTTVMATGLACFYRRVPFGHVEAGLRTYDRWAPFPEELNRRVAALVADRHFAPTRRAADNLLREGVAPAVVHVTGNTVIDALQYVLEHTRPPAEPAPPPAPYVLMTCHRRENFGAPLREIFGAVRDFFARRPDLHAWYPVHPNPAVAGPARDLLGGLPNLRLTPPLDYVAFAHAMRGARLLLTDSGGVQEEAPALGRPVLVLRDVTERPEGVEAGTCRLVGPHRDRILAALAELLDDPAAYARMARARNPYGDGAAAGRIAAALRGAPAPDWVPAP